MWHLRGNRRRPRKCTICSGRLCLFQHNAAGTQGLLKPVHPRTQFGDLIFKTAGEARVHCRPLYSTRAGISSDNRPQFSCAIRLIDQFSEDVYFEEWTRKAK
jgi:hypothetical protein